MPDTNDISVPCLEATVEIPESRLKEIDHYLTDEPASPDDGLSTDDIIVYTARFADGYEMDIQCCGVQFQSDSDNTAYSEARLFDSDGYEVAYDMGDCTLRGDWTLKHFDRTYIAHVVASDVERLQEG